MNRNFLRPLLIIGLAAVITGIIALLIPAWDNSFFPIKKMPWFSALLSHNAAGDSVSVDTGLIEHIPSALDPFTKNLAMLQPLSGQQPLVSSTKPGRKKNLRVAYYSDSTIEGDLITAPLRHSFQSVYGGSGVGMVPITSIVAGFRQTIRHSFSKNWESISFMSSARKDMSLGITGYTFIPRSYYTAQRAVEQPDTIAVTSDTLALAAADIPKPEEPKTQRIYVDYDPWVEYKAAAVNGGAADFRQIRLFYSHAPENAEVSVSYDSAPSQSFYLSSGEAVQMLDLSPVSPVKSIKLQFSRHDPIHVYGMSFDSESGVHVDNYPIRGYSGMYFSRIHEDVLKGFQRHLTYDLVVLQYGENVSNPAVRDYSNYKSAMKRTIEHIKKALPGVPILIVSAHDRSIRDATGYHTSPDIPHLVKTQAELAKETDCAFFNLYEAMGGHNSMIGLVSQKPPLASSDYTHFNRRGADYVAGMLLKFITGDQ